MSRIEKQAFSRTLAGVGLLGALLVGLTGCGGSSSSGSSSGGGETPYMSEPPAIIKDIKLQLSYAQNIGETLYFNADASAMPFFTYEPQFVFVNEAADSATVDAVAVSDADYMTNLTYKCAGKAGALPCTLKPGESFEVLAKLAGFSPASADKKTVVKTAQLQLIKQDVADTESGTQKVLVGEYEMTTEFVPYVPGYIAMRTVNSRAGQQAYLAAAYGANTLHFAKDADGLYKGTIGSEMQFETDSYKLQDISGGLVYVPYGESGTVYLSYEPFNYEAAPSPSQPGTPGFFMAEFTYPNPTTCGASQAVCESLYLDTTYVNFMQYFGSASSIGASSYLPTSVLTGYGYAGATDAAIAKGTEAVFNDIYNEYQTFDAPWKYVPPATPNMTANYFATSVENGTIPDDTTVLYAPVQLFQAGKATNQPMNNDYYDDYINALWLHLETNPIYVDANSITNPAKSNCILKGEVKNNALSFSAVSGNDCPAHAYVVPAMVSSFSSCATGAPEVGGTNCADTPNLTFDKFNTCDFATAAGSNNCGASAITEANFTTNKTLWGPNGTFRAIVGRAITSYQAAGILPICANSGMTEISQDSPMNQTNSRAAIATGKAFENPSCLAGLSDQKPVYNLYSKELSKYVQAYTYSYGDFLGMDATITYGRNAFPGSSEAGSCDSTSTSLFCQLPRALPVTLKIH